MVKADRSQGWTQTDGCVLRWGLRRIGVATRGAMGMVVRSPEERKFDRRVRIIALVVGAFNDERTKILLDTGVNTSSMSETFATTLRLRRLMINDKQIDVQGIESRRLSPLHERQ